LNRVFSRRRTSRRSPAIARLGIAFVAFDHARQKIQEKPAFPDSERGQESFLSGQGRRLQLLVQPRAGTRSAQQSCPAVIRVHATLEKVHRFEPVDHLASARGIDAKPLGQSALVEAWPPNDRNEETIFAGVQAGRESNLGQGTKADLVKAPGQMRRNAVRRDDWIPDASLRRVSRHGASKPSTCLCSRS